MNCKIAEIYDIFICCEVTFEMQTADSEKALFYNCAENVEVEVADVISILSIFVVKGVENELILECLWEWVIKANIFSWINGSVQWTIHSFEKKIVFLNCFSEATSLCVEKNVFSVILN